MKIQQKKTARYIYDPQLIDPCLDFYPCSAFDFDQEPWVAPLCLLAKSTFVNYGSYWGRDFFGRF